MWAKLIPVIVKELGTTHGHVPMLLRQLSKLNRTTRRIVMPYLRWRLERMHPLDVHNMLDQNEVSIEELEFFLAESGW